MGFLKKGETFDYYVLQNTKRSLSDGKVTNSFKISRDTESCLIKAQKLSTIIPQITIKVADPAKEDEQFMNNTNAKIKTSRLRDLQFNSTKILDFINLTSDFFQNFHVGYVSFLAAVITTAICQFNR